MHRESAALLGLLSSFSLDNDYYQHTSRQDERIRQKYSQKQLTEKEQNEKIISAQLKRDRRAKRNLALIQRRTK